MTHHEYFSRFMWATREPTLDVVNFFVGRLGNPQKAFPSVHVTGTNGKGSVCEYLNAIFMEAGLKVGKFMSPYLLKFNEYISVDGVYISDEDVERHLEVIKPLVEEYQTKNPDKAVKYWDILTTMVMLHFRDVGVDIAIIEIGIESEWDCTNIIEPLLTIISRTGIDHTDVLGGSLEEIAIQTAGAIKPKTPVVTSNFREVLRVLSERAKELGSEVFRVRTKDVATANYVLNEPMRVLYKGKEYNIPLKGRHQGMNLALALESIGILKNFWSRGEAITDKCIHEGLKKVVHRARFEIVSKRPYVIFDGAHNADSVRVLMQMVDDFCGKFKHKTFVISVLDRKDADEIMQELSCALRRGSTIIFTGGPRPGGEGSYESAHTFHTGAHLQECYLKFDKMQKEQGGSITKRAGHSKTMIMSFEDALKMVAQNFSTPEHITFFIGSFKTYKYVVEYSWEDVNAKSNFS